MGKELVLRQIVARDGNHYPKEIPLPSDEVIVIQRFSRAGYVGGTIELRPTEEGVSALCTWGRTKVREDADGHKRGMYAGYRGYEREFRIGGMIYLGPDGIYQVQEKV